jgi:hypothetical protein
LKFYPKEGTLKKPPEAYGLPSIYTVQLWMGQFQKQLESGMKALPAMT